MNAQQARKTKRFVRSKEEQVEGNGIKGKELRKREFGLFFFLFYLFISF